MGLPRFALVSAALLIASSGAVAKAQAISQPYPYYQPRPTPPSWSYDPYTSGLGPCPQGTPGDLERCRDRMPPTYGQPSYWPR